MAILFNSIAAFFSLLIFLVTGAFKDFSLPTNPTAYLIVFIAMVCYGLFERGRFVAAKLLDASVLTTVSNIGVPVAFIGAALLYNEPITPNKLLGGLLILVALLLVSYKNGTKKHSAKGIVIAVLIFIALGIGWMLDKAGTTYFNANTYSFLVWTLPLIIIIFPGIKLSALKEEMKIGTWKVYLLAAINVLGYLAQLKALTLTEATRVIPIVQLSTLFTVLMGIIILKERDHIPRKIIAGTIAIIGAILLVK